MNLDLYGLIILLISGLAAVTAIDVLGSISSRKLNYQYVYLTPLSFFVYAILGYSGYHVAPLIWTVIVVCAVGVFDGTFGWKLAIMLEANLGAREEAFKNLPTGQRILSLIWMSGLFGTIGFFLGRIF